MAFRSVVAYLFLDAVAYATRTPLFLQRSNRSTDPGDLFSPGLSSEFFTEDPEVMANMPAFPARAKALHATGDQTCDPKCGWTCGPRKECDQACEPLCAPPECTTLCKQSADKCETRCSPPQCAVVCPAASMCVHGDCARCRTLCGPPQCTTQCSDDCETHCAQPKCTWKCKEGDCPKPKCEMKCTGLKKCAMRLQPATAKMPQQDPSLKVLSTGDATLDPASLFPAAKPPPMWQMTTTLPPYQGGAKIGNQPLGPVAKLKRVWKEEDHREQVLRNEREAETKMKTGSQALVR